MLRDHRLRSFSVVLLILAGGAIGSVALARPGTDGDTLIFVPGDLPKAPVPAIAPRSEYRVGPPDLLVVEVLQALPNKPITGETLVRPDGTISLGYYGQVCVADLTLREAKKKIILQLRKFITDEHLGLVHEDEATGEMVEVDPADSDTVIVDVSAYNSKFYYVLGDVVTPGRLPVTGNDRVLDAIVFCGGLTPSSVPRTIQLARPSPPGASSPQVLPVDLDAITKRGETATNYTLMPGDCLVVSHDPKSDRPVATPDAASVERRLQSMERCLDRIITLMEASQAPRAAPTPTKP